MGRGFKIIMSNRLCKYLLTYFRNNIEKNNIFRMERKKFYHRKNCIVLWVVTMQLRDILL